MQTFLYIHFQTSLLLCKKKEYGNVARNSYNSIQWLQSNHAFILNRRYIRLIGANNNYLSTKMYLN